MLLLINCTVNAEWSNIVANLVNLFFCPVPTCFLSLRFPEGTAEAGAWSTCHLPSGGGGTNSAKLLPVTFV